jgi:hypothetical protein
VNQPNRQLFDKQRHRRFGRSNPERMRLAHWEWMVRERIDPYHVRAQLGIAHELPTEADWCFDRMGMTETSMPDGRSIFTGGEHEDFYDPDFCIYNEVIVRTANQQIEIYGYTEEVFPPTDFHTATLDGEFIVVIGGLGYSEARVPDTTPVYILDCATYQIRRVLAQGPCPGWIYEHQAELSPDGHSITVHKGNVITSRDGTKPSRSNLDDYRLDWSHGRWAKLTDHSRWRQFLIQRTDGQCFHSLVDEGALHPRGVAFENLYSEKERTHRFRVDGVPVQCVDELLEVRVVVEGVLSDRLVKTVLTDIANNIESVTGETCRVLEL